tara:strand:+ start:195 stop:323 length:129 start_codon:yes stop_codon:yes gene_type:complete
VVDEEADIGELDILLHKLEDLVEVVLVDLRGNLKLLEEKEIK